MPYPDSSAIAALRRSPLAACLGAILALGSLAPAAPAATSAPLHKFSAGSNPLLEGLHRRAAAARAQPRSPAGVEGGLFLPVMSCADDGSAGTLRHTVLVASSGDTVDLSALTCSTITLESGAVNIDVDDLAILGPGAGALTIDGNHAGRVFRHGGTGTLQISYLTIANGAYSVGSTGYGGGCIYTKGILDLDGAVIASCATTGDTVAVGGGVLSLQNIVMFDSTIRDTRLTAITGTPSLSVAGGGVFAAYDLVFEFSTVSGNTVTTPLGKAYAAGVFGGQSILAKYSTVTGNSVTTGNAPGSGYYGIGGGLAGRNSVFIQNSTFDNNSADAAAGIYLLANDPGYGATIINSTVSGNHATIIGGGMLASGDLQLENSTIAFNVAGDEGGGGLIVEGPTTDLESNIIADNSPSGAAAAADFAGGTTLTGANNLIKISGAMLPPPPDTITQDPQLGPLAFNGGLTRTHALVASSPAVDAGNNIAGQTNDQRGPGYTREYGTNPDIGAYELDPDVIFKGGFDDGD